ncbi:MAG TPA: CinA family nicotinamide mononucleotide deamidase-related protein, partial [Candidatus Baltobacteraceae bacterium]|nr:CinA family nicotinamide mononucleotide deamidase-related protein [Candidatus Baltobacteraceae bacterium]
DAGLERADGVITSGGLGPTIDDLTKEAVCAVLNCDTETNLPALRAMEQLFASSGRPMRENNRKQAELPRNAIPLPNPNGTAPGFIAMRADRKFIACMPGVPREMKPMLKNELVPWLRSHFKLTQSIYTTVLHTVNIAESEIDHRIDDLFRTLENPKIAVLAHDYRCDVKVMAKAASPGDARSLSEPVEREIEQRLLGHIYGRDDQTLPGAIHELLQGRGQTLAVAESITAGAIGAALTSVPGSSKSFLGGVIAYDNAVKRDLTGVSEKTLAEYGAVSRETVMEMARGVRVGLGSDIALASTGIAGPTGASAEKPVGLVWMGLSSASSDDARMLQLRGDRAAITARAVTSALGLLWKALAGPEHL